MVFTISRHKTMTPIFRTWFAISWPTTIGALRACEDMVYRPNVPTKSDAAPIKIPVILFSPHRNGFIRSRSLNNLQRKFSITIGASQISPGNDTEASFRDSRIILQRLFASHCSRLRMDKEAKSWFDTGSPAPHRGRQRKTATASPFSWLTGVETTTMI